MPKGKKWAAQEENELRQLIEEGKTASEISSKLGKTKNAIYEKAKRLGLKVIINKSARKVITSKEIELPKELPSIEEALRILAGALNAASKAGIDKLEIQRLHVVASLASTYKELFADYINYREIEQKLLELEAKYARFMEKAKNNASKSDTAKMVQPATQ